MKIGLVGVPGSGKTVLAESLKTAFEKIDDKNFLPVTIIDKYVEELQDETDLALSWMGTYIGNAHIALRRENKERIAEKEYKTIISCGTLFETSSYMVQYMDDQYQLIEPENKEAKHDFVLRVEAITRFLACLYADTMRYDYIFYLPPIEEIQDVRIKELEKNLQAAFNGFSLYPVTKLFVEGQNMLEITENRVKMILDEVIHANNVERQDVQTEESDGSGV